MGRKGKKRAEPSGPVAPSPGAPTSRRWRTGLFGLAAAALLLGGVGWAVRPRPREVKRERGLNVLLITVDTLRADALGSYGNGKVATPFMDRLAGGGVRFEQAHAQNVVTLPSHANILSGRYPLDHGIRDNSGFRFPKDTETLATLLGKAGYRTGAFVSAFPLDSRFGLDRGFDVYDDRLGDPESRSAFVMQERRGPETVAAAKAWIDAQQGPFFCWVHVYEPHFPYEPPPALAARFASDPYHGEVSATDAALGPLLEPILGGQRRALVILTADHGESLGEHGEKTHGIFAYEGTLRVPLILYEPRLFRTAVVGARVRHVDLLPTLLDALSLPVPEALPGRSLLPVAAGRETSPAPSYFESLSAATNRGWAPLTGMAKGPWKYIDLPLPELYDLAQDPQEMKNLVASQPQVLQEMQGLLAAARPKDLGVRKTEESQETLERLRSLGYAATGGGALKESYTEDDDPKRLIDLEDAVQEVVTLYQAGDLDSAIRRAREVLERRPDMPLAWQHLGFLLHETGDLGGAVESLKRSVASNPEDADGVALLGAYLNDAGRPAETVRVLGVYARRDAPDLDVLQAYGAALAQVGRPAEAIATYERAGGLDPSNAVTRANLGTVYLMKGDLARARSYMEEALRLEPGVSRAHNALGVIAFKTGHPDEAIAYWKRSVELNPREWDTLFNLGKTLRQQGREAEARPYLERFVREAPGSKYSADIRQFHDWLSR